MSGDSKSELIAAFNLGAGYAQTGEYRRRYKEEKEKADFFLAVESEYHNLHNLLLNRERG